MIITDYFVILLVITCLLFYILLLFLLSLIPSINLCSVAFSSIANNFKCGFYSIILQCKEFSFSYFPITDCLIGPINYFTTGLHGFHVLLGAFLFYITLFYIMLYWIQPFYFMEFSFPLFLSSHYRHFIDFIWLLVFILLLV